MNAWWVFSCYNASFIQRKDHRSDKYNTRSMFLAVMHQYCEKTQNCSMKGQYHEQVWHAMCCYLAWWMLFQTKTTKGNQTESMHEMSQSYSLSLACITMWWWWLWIATVLFTWSCIGSTLIIENYYLWCN